MASINGTRVLNPSDVLPSNHAWIGSAGAAGHDLRSPFSALAYLYRTCVTNTEKATP